MIKIKATLIQAEINFNGTSVSEGACIEIVEKFKAKPESVMITLDRTSIPVGKLIDMEYSKEEKILYGNIELNINIAIGGKPLQSLTTPTGEKILSFHINGLSLLIAPIGGKDGTK